MKFSLTTMVLMALVAGSPFMASAKPPPNVDPLTIGGVGVVPDEFRVTVFATGLDYPYGMVLLDDGSLLVASSHPNNKPTLFSSTGELLRFVDVNRDGIADGPGTVLFAGLPGVVTGLAAIDDLVFVNSSGYDSPGISVLRMGADPGDALIPLGSINFAFPSNWEHRSYGVAVRPSPSLDYLDYELFFNLGSDTNGMDSMRMVPVSGLTSSEGLEEAALYSVRIIDNLTSLDVYEPTLIARGLRNAAAFGFHPTSGDLYITDNGIDNRDTEEPLSVDELNGIFSADIGGSIIKDFGFADNYVEYLSDEVRGDDTNIIPPLVTFQPINSMESEGPAGMAFAPVNFPTGLNNGIFVGFHGKSSAGSSNEENPMVYVDLSVDLSNTPLQYFHFVANTSPDVGHLNGLLATDDSLFAADLSSVGSVENGAGSGVIYQIHALGEPIILTELHVGDLSGESETSARGGKWDATVTIPVHDSGEVDVPGSTVIGSWSSGASGTGSCITDDNGNCSITKNRIGRNVPSVTFKVTNVTGSDAIYSPDDNHDLVTEKEISKTP